MHAFTIALVAAMFIVSNQAATGAEFPAVSPEVTPGHLAAEFSAAGLFASLHFGDAFPRETREEVASGLEIEFLHQFEVARRRPFWFDRTLVRRTVRATATYDSLTRQYRLGRQIDGEPPQNAVALTEQEMIAWMSSIERLRLSATSDLPEVSDGSLYVRVKSRVRRRFLLMFIPWDVETAWEKVKLAPPKRAGEIGS